MAENNSDKNLLEKTGEEITVKDTLLITGITMAAAVAVPFVVAGIGGAYNGVRRRVNSVLENRRMKKEAIFAEAETPE